MKISKRKVSVRLNDDELIFLEGLIKQGMNLSTAIRFCINLAMIIKNEYLDKRLRGEIEKIKAIGRERK